MNDWTEDQWMEWQAKRPTVDVEAFADCLSFTIDRTGYGPKIEVKTVGRHYRTIESTISISIYEKDLAEELTKVGNFFLEQAERSKENAPIEPTS